jgi:atypical dual specificity phosphatase
MTKEELAEFLSQSTPLTVEEKIDGANLGVSMADDFSLRFQNRSHFVNATTAAQWSQLDAWASQNSADLYTLLAPFTNDDGAIVRRVLFGEWMYARHSVAYNKLPAYFVAFDIAENGELLSVQRRNELLAETAIPVIARVAEPASYTLEQLLGIARRDTIAVWRRVDRGTLCESR